MSSNDTRPNPTSPITLALFWLYVSVPLAWGVWSTLQKAMALFN